MTPIRTPFGARWRRWRWKIVHAAVFGLLCAGIVAAWQRLSRPSGFTGQVEAIQCVVSSRDAGFITNLWVLPMQEIRIGDLVAEVITTDPRTVNNRLELMRDRMRLIALEMEPVLSRQRTALAFEQLSVDSDRVKAEMKVAAVKFEQAQSQFKRDETLFKQGALSAELLDLSRRSKEAYEVEMLEKSNLVARAEKALDRLRSTADTFVPGGENDPIRQALALEEEKTRIFEAKMTPLRMNAPTNGVVTAIHRHAGEQILAGEPIVTITASQSFRIVGFLPQHFPVEPVVGMPVEVTTRGFHRRKSRSTVIGVSPHLESITNALVAPLAVRPVLIPPMGRLISVSLPRDMKLLPGEPVDLALRPDWAGTDQKSREEFTGQPRNATQP